MTCSSRLVPGSLKRRSLKCCSWYRLRLVLLLCAGLLPLQQARAQERAAEQVSAASEREAQARRAFEQGRVSFDVGNFQQALRSFERAYELSGRPELLFNIGTVLDRMRRDGEAASSFERYLAELPEADNRLAVEARLKVLHERLAGDAAREVAPSAAEVARNQASADEPLGLRYAAADGSLESQDSATPLRKKWWFWTTLAVVVGGGVAAAVLLTRDEEPKEAAPLLGSQNAFTQALYNH